MQILYCHMLPTAVYQHFTCHFEHWDRLQLSKEFKRTSRMRMDSYHALQLLLPIHSLGRIVPTRFKVFSLHALLYLQHTKAAVYSSNRSAAFAKLRQRFDVPSAPYPHRHQTYRSVEQENTDQKGIEDTNEQKKHTHNVHVDIIYLHHI